MNMLTRKRLVVSLIAVCTIFLMAFPINISARNYQNKTGLIGDVVVATFADGYRDANGAVYFIRFTVGNGTFYYLKRSNNNIGMALPLAQMLRDHMMTNKRVTVYYSLISGENEVACIKFRKN